MGWRDGTIREVMADELAEADRMLAEAAARVFVTEGRDLDEPPGVIEATFRVVEDERMPPDTVALIGENGSLVVVDNVGDVRTD
jgi:hypothetical protein